MTLINNKGQEDLIISTPEVENKYGVNIPQLRTGIEVLGGNSEKTYYISDVTFSCLTSTTTVASLGNILCTNGMNITNNRATITKDGIYQISANITWNSNSSSGIREVAIVVNGTNYFIVNSDNAKTFGWSYTNLSGAKKLLTGDYVELKLFQDSGVTIGENGSSNEFSIVEI